MHSPGILVVLFSYVWLPYAFSLFELQDIHVPQLLFLMEWVTIERFKEPEFSVNVFVQESYAAARSDKDGVGVLQKILDELEKLRDALEYKEEEESPGVSSPESTDLLRREIEEVSEALSSIRVSEESRAFLAMQEERDAVKTRMMYIEYMESLAQKTIQDTILKEESPGVLARFLSQTARALGLSLTASFEASNGGSPGSSYGDGYGSITPTVIGDAVVLLRRRIEEEYVQSLSSGSTERASRLVRPLFDLGSGDLAMSHILNTSRIPAYSPTVMDKIDVLGSTPGRSLISYLDEMEKQVSQILVLAKSVLMQREDITDEEYRKCALEVFQKVSGRLAVPLLDDLTLTDDPFEFLIKREYASKRMMSLKDSVGRLVPPARKPILAHRVLGARGPRCVQREVEALNTACSILLSLSRVPEKGSRGKTEPQTGNKYVISGKMLHDPPETPVSLFFRYLAISRRSLLRARILAYTPQETDRICEVLLGNASQLISATCEGRTRPFVFLAAHLSLYLCTKRMISETLVGEEKIRIGKRLESFTRVENERSRRIMEVELSVLSDSFSVMSRADFREALDAIDQALSPLLHTPLQDPVLESALDSLLEKTEKKLDAATSSEEIKEVCAGIALSKTYSKKSEAFASQTAFARLGAVADCMLMEPEDAERVLLGISATDAEKERVRNWHNR